MVVMPVVSEYRWAVYVTLSDVPSCSTPPKTCDRKPTLGLNTKRDSQAPRDRRENSRLSALAARVGLPRNHEPATTGAPEIETSPPPRVVESKCASLLAAAQAAKSQRSGKRGRFCQCGYRRRLSARGFLSVVPVRSLTAIRGCSAANPVPVPGRTSQSARCLVPAFAGAD